MSNTKSAVEERALSLLGQGIEPIWVASAIGVSESRISQLIADPGFSSRVSELRYKSLAQHNARDNRYNQLEETLLDRIENLLPMMFKPMEILKAISVINGAVRRGASAPETILEQRETVRLTIPSVVVNQQFITNVNNQVIKAGEQDLVTVQSVQMPKLLRERMEQLRSKVTNHGNVIENHPGASSSTGPESSGTGGSKTSSRTEK